MVKASSKSGHNPDYVFIFCLMVLVVFGLLMLSSASSDIGKIKFNDTYYYLKHQLLGLVLGTIGFIFASFLNYRYWKKFATFLLIASLAALILVFTPLGKSEGGATRWLNIGTFSVQPSEFLKLSFIIFMAAWLSSKKAKTLRQTSFLAGYLPFLIICGLISFIIFIQPATTTAIIVVVAGLFQYFVSGAKMSYIAGTIIIGLLCLGLLISITSYRWDRVTSFFNRIFHQNVNSKAEGYQLNQALIAIGSGGITGVGFGKSTTKFQYLPEPIGDSIFAVIGEEFGFIGILLLLSTFVLLFIRGFIIAKNSSNEFAKLVAVGFTTVFAVQTFIHVAAISGILPLTGVPLPFISYGSTSLAVLLTMAGVTVNISKYTD